MVPMSPVRRRHALVALVAVGGALAGALAYAGPAVAQTPSTDETTSSTEATTSTSEPATTTTAPDTTTTTAVDPGVNGDAPPESVPDVSVTIPPREPPTGEGSGAV